MRTLQRCLRRSWVASSLALALASQATAQRSPQELAILEARYLNQVLVVAGDQVITDRDLGQHLQADRYRERLQTVRTLPPQQAQPELNRLQRDAMADLVEIFLATQAGQDRGFDPKIVDTLAERRFRDRAKAAGGFQKFSNDLRRSGLTPEDFKNQIRQQLYRFAWQGAVTGRQTGTTGRKEVDRYVRPGELRKAYRNFRSSRFVAERDLIGEKEATFKLQELALGFAQMNGREKAVERANAIREEIAAGRMTVQNFIDRWKLSDPEAEEKATVFLTRSQAGAVSEQTFGSTRFFEFVRTSKPGDLSPIFESDGAAHLFYVVEVTPAQAAKPFRDSELQNQLRDHLLGRQESKRLGRAFRTLIEENRLSDRALADFMLSPAWIDRER